MEGSHADKKDPQRYFERFRKLSRGFVEYLFRHHPLSAREDWQCQCYQSFSAFLTRFPTLAHQQHVIRRLRRTRRRVRDLSPALDLLVEWAQEHCEIERNAPDLTE